MACFACPRQCDFYLLFKLIAAWSTNLPLSGVQNRSKASFDLAPICFQYVLFRPPSQTLIQHCCKLPSQGFLRSSLQGIHPQAHGDRYQKNDCQQNANADHHFLFHAIIPSFQICHLPYINIDAMNRKMFLQCIAYNAFSAFSSPPSAHEDKLTCKRMEQKSPGGMIPPGLLICAVILQQFRAWPGPDRGHSPP